MIPYLSRGTLAHGSRLTLFAEEFEDGLRDERRAPRKNALVGGRVSINKANVNVNANAKVKANDKTKAGKERRQKKKEKEKRQRGRMNQVKGKVATTTGTNKNEEERGRVEEEPREYTGMKPNVNKSRLYLIYILSPSFFCRYQAS